MKRKTTQTFMFAIGIIALISSCNNSKYPDYEMAENGLYYKFYKQNENAKKAEIGGVVFVKMFGKNSKDSIIFDSKDPRFDRTGDGTIYFPLRTPEFKGSLDEGIMMMRVGDSASFIISSDSLFIGNENERPPFIEKGSDITYYVTLTKFMTKEEVEKEQKRQQEEMAVMMETYKSKEPELLANYLSENKIKTKPTKSGLYFIEKVKGKGETPAMGKLVKVNYTGRLIDGTVFDSNDETISKEAGIFNPERPYEPFEFALGAGQVIRGWDEAIAMMKPGGKAQLIIPSQIAYGDRGAGTIPPYSTLIFDVELVSYK